MFLDFLRAFYRRRVSKEQVLDAFSDAMECGAKCMSVGDYRGAVKNFRHALTFDPCNVGVLNDLGACLSDMGDVAGAQAAFDLAYSLDDTHMAAIVNRARMLIDLGRGEEALPLLKRAKIIAADFDHVESVYGGYCMAVGNVADAVLLQRKAWLANFEKLRYANCYLFYSSYADGDEAELAAEHRFWAETLRPLDIELTGMRGASNPGRRMRVGYWSPDLRRHSVRYFFRPLILHHDKNTVETFVYHDGPVTDDQTLAIKADSEHFYDVFSLGDQDLYDLMISHDLDVLVELAGHSSHNRILFLQNRLARVQVTALGYPPTTGLTTIDAKILDSHIVDSTSPSYYTEKPFALPSSFWCFDPMEEVPQAAPPPCLQNSWVTFGCVGNIAKITDAVARSWVRILASTPGSKLLIRSINFKDSGVMEVFRRRMVCLGFDADRLILKRPEGGVDFYTSYNEVDVILDTFPFNGGTTTCFAAYMGVPVVTMSGKSLLSRMGKSVMTNLGLSDLVVDDLDGYVEVAVRLACDTGRLKSIRSTMRDRFMETSLGDGRAYAKDFESACVELLTNGVQDHPVDVPVLPLGELLRRAYQVMQRGPSDALNRIVNYVQLRYPDNGSVKLLQAQVIGLGNRRDAINRLREDVSRINDESKVGVLITLAGWCLQEGMVEEASHYVSQIRAIEVDNAIDALHVRMISEACMPERWGCAPSVATCDIKCNVLVVVIADSHQDFQKLVADLTELCDIPPGLTLDFQWQQRTKRVGVYGQGWGDDYDYIILMHDYVRVVRKDFFCRLLSAFADDSVDVVGFFGAKRWTRLDWRLDEFETKGYGYLARAAWLGDSAVEIRWCGSGFEEMVGGFSVLDGALLAVKRSAFEFNFEVDDDLNLTGSLLEELWSYKLSCSGLNLVVHRNLGILLEEAPPVDLQSRVNVLLELTDELGVDPLSPSVDDAMCISAVLGDVDDALVTMDYFVGGEYA